MAEVTIKGVLGIPVTVTLPKPGNRPVKIEKQSDGAMVVEFDSGTTTTLGADMISAQAAGVPEFGKPQGGATT